MLRADQQTRVRTSVDLELDLQAYRVCQDQLNDEINTLRDIRRHLEDAKAQGDYRTVVNTVPQYVF